MLLIVAHHYVVNSGLTTIMNSDPTSSKSLFLYLFGGWGKIGINCFVLITGYFMCQSKITVKKFLKLFLEFMFYKIVINSIFWITGYAEFSLLELIPIRSIDTGFTPCYLIFFMCIPFINTLISHLSEKMHIRLIVLSLFTYTLLGFFKGNFGFNVAMNYVSWFIVLYFISSYVRLYPKEIFDNTKFWGIAALLSVIISAISIVVSAWLGTKFDAIYSFYFVTDSNTVLAVITGFSTFMLFKNVKIKTNKFINTVAASTFGVLCIHANSDAMRRWLWKDTLNNAGMYDSSLLVVHAIGSVIGIFAVCTLIDYLRIRFIEKPFFRIWDKNEEKVKSKFEKIEEKVLRKLKIQNT